MMLIINQQQREQSNKSHCCYKSNDNDENPAAELNPANDDDDDDYNKHNNDTTTTTDNLNNTTSNTNNNSDDDARLVAALGDYDVLCGRHKAAFNNTGNRRFRITVSLSLSCFMKASSRKEKNTVIKSILKIVQGNGGRFLEYDKKVNAFVELTAKKAHMKVGHALRDMALANRKELVVENGTSSNNRNNNAGIQVVLTANPSDATAMAVVPTTTMQSYPDTTTPLHNNYVEQPVMDPWDLLQSSIPATSSSATNGGGPLPRQQRRQQQQPVDDQQNDLDMLQWLVGESDGLLLNHFDSPEQMMMTMLDEEPPLLSVTDVPQQYQQQHYQPPLPFSNSVTTSTGTFLPLTTMTTRTTSETTTTSSISIIEPIPLSIGNNSFNSSTTTMDEKDDDNHNDNDSHSLRESFVLDDSLLQWLVGESNDVAMDRFEMV